MLKTLPPREVDAQDAILFVLVGSQKDTVKGSSLLRAPRSEYAAAVECLRQTNPFYAEVTLGDGGDDLLEGCVLETAEDSALAKELLQNPPTHKDKRHRKKITKTMAPLKTKIEAKKHQAERGCFDLYSLCRLAIVGLTVGAVE